MNHGRDTAPLPLQAGAREVCGFFGLDAAACARLRLYVEELGRWNARMNLVAPATLNQVWQRHVADGLQLLQLLPRDASQVIDLGSGSGVPGLVMALAAPQRARHVLVEANHRKCGFLRRVAQLAEIDITILTRRIETLDADDLRVDARTVIVARALAPLGRLLDMAAPLFAAGASALLPKGRTAAQELREARRRWRFDAETFRSVTDPQGVVVRLRGVKSV